MQKIFEKISNPAIFIIAAALIRLIPHAPNFAPIGAMALFSGTYLNKKTAFLLPLLAMILSDFFIGFDSFSSRLTVYSSFALVTLMGFWLRSNRSVSKVIVASLGASISFFLITNLGVWLFGSLYPKTVSGLVSCFVAAIPFFRNSLISDIFYVTIFMGGYELIRNYVPAGKLAKLKLKVKNG